MAVNSINGAAFELTHLLSVMKKHKETCIGLIDTLSTKSYYLSTKDYKISNTEGYFFGLFLLNTCILRASFANIRY